MAGSIEKFVIGLGQAADEGLDITASAGTVVWAEARPAGMPEVCTACTGAGGIFDSAFAYPNGKGRELVAAGSGAKARDWIVVYIFRLPEFGKVLAIRARGERFFSVSGKIQAALWDERKMREISGAEFSGLQDARPIVMHPENAGNGGTYHFEGTGADGEFEIPVGPVHAGIIESGHFRFHVAGEEINKLEVRLGYVHKGIESIAVKKPLDGIFPLIEQISGDESVANSVAYAQAVEAAAGIKPSARGESLRLILLEMERVCSHLADLGGISMDIGYYASSSRFTALREDMMRLNRRISGSRFLRGMVSVGGLCSDISDEKLRMLPAELDKFSKSLLEIEDLTTSSSTFLDRAFTTGRVLHETAKGLSLVGPAARASGIRCDLRAQFPYGGYKANKIGEEIAEGGDVLARFMVKFNEIEESVRLIRKEVSKKQKGAVCAGAGALKRVPEGSMGIGVCEAPRGACTIVVQAGKQGTVGRLMVRTASFRNWRAIEKAVLNNIVADFPLINKSFNLSYSGADL